MIEGIKFIKAEEKYIYSYWQTFDKIAKERKYLAMDEAFPFEETVELIKKNSRNYAKRQYTWFNNQMPVKWFDVNLDNFNNTVEEVIEYLKYDEFL